MLLLGRKCLLFLEFKLVTRCHGSVMFPIILVLITIFFKLSVFLELSYRQRLLLHVELHLLHILSHVWALVCDEGVGVHEFKVFNVAERSKKSLQVVLGRLRHRESLYMQALVLVCSILRLVCFA